MRKKDLIDRVAASSGSKPGDVKKVVEAALAFIAERLGQEETLNLPPLGKLTLAKRKDTPKGEVLTLKLRRAGAEKTVKGPLAAQGE
ncbi:HU family DNA-binding protein [Defluviimonas sp. WL0002]|uniref:HU family DNA-binding protein n=1 Tax=Albidovulum marisflavi TaxID=2984159 RepID=A0ABT2ZFG4_9RHOB|nr:HU family DNA-binding protein [Defluviimonas sp. WL0002]MCV2869864.1 HU family DNA-binding protein [Defluviimonas sp. WL0002]